MKTIRLCTVLFLFGTALTGFAQNTSGKIDVNTHIDLTKVYEQYVKEGYGTPEIYKELANGHYFKNNFSQAKKWFEKLFESGGDTDPTLQFRYRQTLKALKVQQGQTGKLVTVIE